MENKMNIYVRNKEGAFYIFKVFYRSENYTRETLKISSGIGWYSGAGHNLMLIKDSKKINKLETEFHKTLEKNLIILNSDEQILYKKQRKKELRLKKLSKIT